MKQTKTISRRELVIGGLLWFSSLQYYIIQILVARAWDHTQATTYSWRHNTISDLGNSRCGLYGRHMVCSPWHPAMNLSFMLLGLTMVLGALLLQRRLRTGRLATLGFGCMILAGLGTILVGLFPENTVSLLHVIGAALPFIVGNLGLLLLASGLRALPKILRGLGLVGGLAGLVALPLFTTGTVAGLGTGGVERIVGYPQSLWMIVTGAYLLWRYAAKSLGSLSSAEN